MALNARNVGQAGETASRVVMTPAARERMAANQAKAANSDIFREAKGFSLTGSLGSVWGTLTNVIMFAPMLAGVVGWLGKKSSSGVISKTAGVMKLGDKPITTRTLDDGTVVKGLQESITDLFPKHGEKIGARLGAVGEFAQKTIGKGKFGSSVLENVKRQSVSNLVFNAGFSAQQVGSVVLDTNTKLKTIRQMEKDLAGLPPSTISGVIANARKEVTGMRAMLSNGLKVAGAAGNMYLAIFDKSTGWKSMAKAAAVGMVPGLVANGLSASNTAIQSYRDMTLSMAQTGKADASLYEGLIGGLAQNAPADLVRKISEKAYVQQLAPSEVLKMMAETDLLKKPGTKSFVAAEASRRAAAPKGRLAMGAA